MRRLAKYLAAASTALLAVPALADELGKPVDRGIQFQDPATPVAEMVNEVHNIYILPIILGIVVFVLVLMVYIMVRFREKANPVPSKTSHHTGLEIAWTIIPVLLLFIIVVPSMRLLYFQDRIPDADMTVKVVGDTWAWNYAYPDFADNVDEYVSNMLPEDAANELGVPYLLASDAPMVVPVDTTVKVLVTSYNNMHSWTVPSFGIKMDAVPGVVNETWFHVAEEGTYYGQCSEICGIKHAFMPIHVEVVSKPEFAQWIANGGTFDAPPAVAELETETVTEAPVEAAASEDALN